MASEFPPSGDKPRTALELALEEAKKKAGDNDTPVPTASEPTISPEAARLEAEEQKEIDKAIARMRGEGGVAPDIAPDIAPKPRIKLKNVDAVLTAESSAMDVKAENETSVPAALKEIFDDVVPRKAAEMYEKLKSPKKQESYLAHLRAEKEKEDKRNLAKEEKRKKSAKTSAKSKQLETEHAPVPEKPFDPHSVQSAVSVEEQKRNEKIREFLAEDGLIAPEAVRSTEVDISGVRVPQYTEPPASTQAEMDALAGEPTEQEKTSATPEQWDWKSAKEAAIAENVQAEERELVPESVPTEVIGKSEVEAERKKLRGLVDRLVGKAKRGGEKIKESADWWKSSSEHLIRRSKELDAEAEKVGGLEKTFRRLGEQYNKLGWKSKLAVGLGLGLGAGISMAAVSLPGIIAFTAGIGAQRAAGLATMYLKYEKAAIEKGKDKESKFWKEKQMAKAMLYTAGMTAGMAYAVKEISETEFAQRAAQWLKEHWPSGVVGAGHSAPTSPEYSLSGEEIRVTQPPGPVPIPSSPAEGPVTSSIAVEAPASEVASAEVAPPSIAPEVVPDMPVVEATPGFGYEYMAKRLWEQLQEKGVDPDSFAEGSDIRRLLEADASSINKVVHELAEKNEFFKPDGTSVRIDVGSTLSFNNEGALALNGSVSAPEAAPLTPSYSPAPPASVAAPEVPEMPDYKTEAAAIGVEVPAPMPPVEPIPDSVPFHDIKGAPAEHLVSEPMTDIPAPSEPSAPLQSPESLRYIPAPDEVPVPPPETISEAPAEPSIPAAEPPVVAEQVADSITNQYGLEVSISKPHIYADANAERLFVYGGSPEVRAETIAKYLAENPKNVVFAADDSGTYRIPWHLVDGKPEPGAPMRTSGLFGFFSTWMSPPEPGEFAKVVK